MNIHELLFICEVFYNVMFVLRLVIRKCSVKPASFHLAWSIRSDLTVYCALGETQHCEADACNAAFGYKEDLALAKSSTNILSSIYKL